MEIIRFNEDYLTHEVNINMSKTQNGGNAVTIIFNNDVPRDVITNGFVVFATNGLECGLYPSFNTIYKEIDEKTIVLSDDNSVYVEPVVEEPQPEEPHEYTPEEIAELKKDKISESKALLESYLDNNPIVSTCHGNKEGKYSITFDKQILMTNQYLSYQIEKEINPDAVLRWNETEKSCEIWKEEEFLQLILEVKAVVYPLVSKQQFIEEQIYLCSTIEDLEAIVIDYSS